MKEQGTKPSNLQKRRTICQLLRLTQQMQALAIATASERHVKCDAMLQLLHYALSTPKHGTLTSRNLESQPSNCMDTESIA